MAGKSEAFRAAAGRSAAGERPRYYRALPLVFAYVMAVCCCGADEGSGIWSGPAGGYCATGRLEASPALRDAGGVSGMTTGFRGAGLSSDDLTPCGRIEILRADTLVEGMDITGSVEIKAPRATVRNCRIRSSDRYPVRVFPGGSLAIEYTEIVGTRSAAAAVSPDNYTAWCLDIHGAGEGFRAGSNVIIECCYVHDLAEGDGSGGGIRLQSGRNVLIRYNTVQAPAGPAAAITIATDAGPIDNVLIDGNIVSGGEFVISSRTGGALPAAAPTNVRIINNRLGRVGANGPLFIDGKATVRGNVWLDSGEAARELYQ